MPKYKYISFIFIYFFISCSYLKETKAPNQNTFNFNLPYSPQSFDPLLQRGTTARYLLNNLYTTLLKWDQTNQLVPYAAESCKWEDVKLICKLKKKLNFQDKTPIYAKHFINTFNLIKKEQPPSFINFNDINIIAPDENTLVFSSKTKKQSLLNALTQIETSPRKEEKYYKTSKSVLSSTKFKIAEFKKNQFILLDKINSPLKIKVYFIEDQATALRLYQSKKLNLLTMMPTRELNQYQNSNELLQINMIRMDGIFFNPKMDLNLKKALFHSLNYEELKMLYHSIGMPGCPPIPKSFYLQTYCYQYDLTLAKEYLTKYKKQNPNWNKNELKLIFSSIGGDDIQKGMEWMANQWVKNLNLKIQIAPLESGVFYQNLKDRKYDIARKGLPLDSPTCLDALYPFKEDNENNFSGFKDKRVNQIIVNLEENQNKTLCDKGLEILYNNYVYIPLGEMYFSFLDDHRFTGWYINSLNALDFQDIKLNAGDTL